MKWLGVLKAKEATEKLQQQQIRLAPAQAAQRPPAISTMADLPSSFRLLTASGGEVALTEARRSQFAALYTDKEVVLLVAESEYGRAAMFDLRSRLQAHIRDKALRCAMVERLATAELIKLVYQHHEQQQQSKAVAASQDASDVEHLIDEMVQQAIEWRTSDIHIEARGASANVFFRVNGQRRLWRELAYETARSIGSVLYVHADAGSKDVSWSTDQVQDCATEWKTRSGKEVQLRFSSSPIYPAGGFQVVLRLLSMEVKGVDLTRLGYSEEQMRMLDIMSTGSSGILLICGPTNSGKSTTLQGVMQRIYARRGDTIKMITVEDPVEYVIPGACQIPVSRKRKTIIDERSGSAFTTFLRGTLRQDPDVVMVGEIRDYDSAVVVKDLVLAGRKILATLHTYSALWAYMRLREIGVPWEILTMPGFIAGIVYQRLVPTLCPHCSIPLTQGGAQRLPADVLFRVQQVSDLALDNVRVKGDGCEACNMTGVSGRTVCAEFVLPDRELLKLLAKNDLIGAERYWRDSGVGAQEQGGVTALAHALHKMRQGLLSPMDVEDQIGLLTADMVNADNMIASSELSLLAGVTQ